MYALFKELTHWGLGCCLGCYSHLIIQRTASCDLFALFSLFLSLSSSPAIVCFPVSSPQWMKSANLTGQMICHVCQERRVKGGLFIALPPHCHCPALLKAKLPTEPFYSAHGPTWDLPSGSPIDTPQIYQANNRPNFCDMCFQSILCVVDCLAFWFFSVSCALLAEAGRSFINAVLFSGCGVGMMFLHTETKEALTPVIN